MGASAEDGLRETRQRLGDEDAGGTGSGLNLVLAEVPADEQISKKSKTRSYAGAWSVCSLFAVRSRLELFNSREKYKILCMCSCVCVCSVFEGGTSAPMQSTLFHPRTLGADEPTAPRCTFYWLGRIGEY